MQMIRGRRSAIGRFERLWVLVCTAALLLLACRNFLDIPLHGMGLIRKDGVFVLIKGPTTRAIDQALGFRVYALQWALVVLGLAAAVFTIGVLARYKRLNLSAILPGSEGKIWRFSLILSFLVMALSILAAHGLVR
jgi:hypothetical protein